MTPAEAKKRITELRAEVAKHDELYYRKAQPEIEDYEYDQLKAGLRTLEESYPEIAISLGESPINRIGDDRAEGFLRTKHRQPMMTLENTYDEGELREFHSRLAKHFQNEELVFSVEPKIDGASISLTYENGRLARAVTRGDGEEGDDVTSNVQTIKILPAILRKNGLMEFPDLIEIRGEIFIRFEEFARINEQQTEDGLPSYANPRNLAAGSLKILDLDIVRDRKLEIVLYGVGESNPPLRVNTQIELHHVFDSWGLPTLEHFKITEGIEETLAAVRNLDVLRKTLPYATDGAVVKLNSFSLQAQIGYRGEGQASRKLSPRWACAFKFPPERAETLLENITIQVGRTGVLTPVAELKPVTLAGTTVARATLHNRDEIEKKDIRIHDYVFVEKKGEIIPAIVKVNLARRSLDCVRFEFPAKCPSCQSAVQRIPGEAAIRCPNQNCPEQLIARLDYVASRAVLDFEGLGGAVARKLVEKRIVKDFFDLFKLEHAKLARLERSESTGLNKAGAARKPPEVGDKNADKIIAAIKKARELDLSRWIMAMQVRGVGAATAQELAALHGSFEALSDSRLLRLIVDRAELKKELELVTPYSRKNPPKDEKERAERLVRKKELESKIDSLTGEIGESGKQPNVGPIVASHVIATFESPRGRDFLEKLVEHQIRPTANRVSASGPLLGKKIVLTGSLSAIERSEAKRKIELLGGKVADSVSKKTDFVVAGSSAGSKLDDAKRLDIRVLTEAEFLKLIGFTKAGQDEFSLE